MGGYGALRLALAHPDRFAAAASLSGAVDVAAICERTDEEEALLPEVERHSMFGETPAVRGGERDLFQLARRVAAADGPSPRLYLYCGTADFLYPMNTAFRDTAMAAGLDVTYAEDGDSHNWGAWDREILKVLAWLPLGRTEA